MWRLNKYKCRLSNVRGNPTDPTLNTTTTITMADVTTAANRVINPVPGGLTIDRVSDRDSKHAVEHDELADNEKVLPQDAGPADRFGTSTSYSPEEKKLVRKLDTYIMPIVFCMYFMNKWVPGDRS